MRASSTSSGRWTNDKANQSTPNWQENSKSFRSFSDKAAKGKITSGTLTPLRFDISPPTITSQLAKSLPQSKTFTRNFPSFINNVDPTFKAANISS